MFCCRHHLSCCCLSDCDLAETDSPPQEIKECPKQTNKLVPVANKKASRHATNQVVSHQNRDLRTWRTRSVGEIFPTRQRENSARGDFCTFPPASEAAGPYRTPSRNNRGQRNQVSKALMGKNVRNRKESSDVVCGSVIRHNQSQTRAKVASKSGIKGEISSVLKGRISGFCRL